MWKRLRGLVQRKATESELNEELAFHLEMEIRQNVRLGMGPAEARRAARVTFGGVDRYRARVWEVRSVLWRDRLVHVAETTPRDAAFQASEPTFLDFARANRTFAALSRLSRWPIARRARRPARARWPCRAR